MAFSSRPCNPNAQDGSKNVFQYLTKLSGHGIITGQHKNIDHGLAVASAAWGEQKLYDA